jgi:hypothetical protein
LGPQATVITLKAASYTEFKCPGRGLSPHFPLLSIATLSIERAPVHLCAQQVLQRRGRYQPAPVGRRRGEVDGRRREVNAAHERQLVRHVRVGAARGAQHGVQQRAVARALEYNNESSQAFEGPFDLHAIAENSSTN